MNGWKVSKSRTLLATPRFDVVLDTAEDFAGVERELYRLRSSTNGYVMIMPVKINKKDNSFKFVMVEQYRYNLNTRQLEFPAGKRESGEDSEKAALRELKEETGYDAKSIKFMYRTFVGGTVSSEEIYFYVALVEDDPGPVSYTDREAGSEMCVKEFTSDEIHKLILNNELTNTASMSALLVLMLQSQEAIKYLMPQENSL